MARDISISIAVQGEKEFNRALKDAQSAVKVLASELQASEAAFDENADAQAFFANKTKNISDQIDQQKTILNSLKQAIADAGEEFGEASAKTDKYRIAANKTQAEIAKLERSLRETQREAEEFGRDSTRIGRQMEDGIGDAADDVSDKLDRMVKQIESDLSDIGGAVEFSAMMDAGEALKSAGDALASFTEGTEDYRRQMSFLEQNAADSGFDFEYIKGQLFEIASLTGDADGAFEAISNLMATSFDSKELEEAIDLIGGAVIRFPETMKFENLAESLQESVAAGNATGAYAELLERLGVDLEEVNKSLEKAKTNEEAQQIALAYLNEHGLEETVENYKTVNADLIASEQAQLKFNEATAALGESLTPAATAWTKFKTNVVTGLTEMIEGYKAWNEQLLQRNEEAKGVVDEAVADSTTFESLEAYNEAIAQADAEGAYIRANALVAERDKFLKEQAQKMAEELDAATQEDASTIGANIATELGNGITEGAPNAIRAADSMWQDVNNQLSRTVTIPVEIQKTGAEGGYAGTTAGSYAAGGQNSTVTVVTQIDGQTVANATAGGVNNVLGAQAQRTSTYNR